MLTLTIVIMADNTKKQHLSENFHLTISGEIISISIKSKVTAQTVNEIQAHIEAAAQLVKEHGKRPTVLIDASKLRFSDITSEARATGRAMFSQVDVDGWAVYGTAHIGMLVDYIGRAAGMRDKLRYFSDRQRALAWLNGAASPVTARPSIGLVVGIIISLIGIIGLIGWQLDSPYLKSILPHLRPINPLAAVGLVALGIAFVCYWKEALKPLRILGIVGIVLGISTLLPLGLDTVLFHDAVQAGTHTQLADSAAICFILSGLLGLLANRNGKWVQPAEYTFAGLMGIIALFNIYGQLYAYDFIYSLSGSFVMAINLAIAFLVASAGMIMLVLLRRTQTALQRVTRSGWLLVIVLILVQIATYGSWVQVNDRGIDESKNAFVAEANQINEQVSTRLQAYVSTLHGFRGLFAASSNVSQGDFDAYYKALNLEQTYPGLRTIAFIAAVKTADIPAFVKEKREDDSLVPGGHPQFKAYDLTAEPLHFLAAYVSNTPNSAALGRDLTSIPGRSPIYNSALKSNGYYSSGTITFAASAAQPATKGFFLATPVHPVDNTQPIGIVTANFNYKDFFGAILKSIKSDLAISVQDTDTKAVIYTSGQAPTGNNILSQTITTSLAQNQSWQIKVQARANFGATRDQSRLASAVLFYGQIFTFLLGGIFIMQIRARGQALALADAVTEDLQTERDTIASLHIKDEAMLGGIGEGLIVVDKNGKIEITNDAATKLLGFSKDEMIDQNILDLLRVIDEKGQLIPNSKRPFEQALKRHRTVTARLIYIRKDYRQVPVKVTVSPIILHGEPIGTIEVFSDITREKQLEHMKDEFLSVASHELRTPMGAIRANLSMILDGDYGPVNKDLVEPLTDMKASTIRLVELVNDLLNVARIEAGRMRFNLKEFEVKTAAKNVVASLAPLGKEKGVEVIFSKNSTDATIQADIDKTEQILTNLVGNSLKFTDKGSITVTTKVVDDMITIAVTDTGIGITPEDQAKLFGKFNQITSAQAGKPAGTGLGLYISREMARKMGGDMWIEASHIGKGSTFVFSIPQAGTAAAKKAKKTIEQEAKLHPDQI